MNSKIFLLRKMKLRWSQSRELLLCSSKRTIPLLAPKKKNRIKSQFNDELFRQFHLIQKPLQRHRAKQLNCYCLTEKKTSQLARVLKKLYENRIEHRLLRSCKKTQKKNRVWEFIADIESSNTIVIVYLKTLQLAHVFDLTVN